MNEQVFTDGIGTITIVGGTARIDFVVYSPTERNEQGQPIPVFCHRVIMGPEAFLHSTKRMQEAAQALSKLPAQAGRVVATTTGTDHAQSVPVTGSLSDSQASPASPTAKASSAFP